QQPPVRLAAGAVDGCEVVSFRGHVTTTDRNVYLLRTPVKSCPPRRDAVFTRSRMRIADLRIHPIAVADPPLRSSYGLHAPYALRTIVELISDDKIVGIAETYGGEAQVAQLEALRPQ